MSDTTHFHFDPEPLLDAVADDNGPLDELSLYSLGETTEQGLTALVDYANESDAITSDRFEVHCYPVAGEDGGVLITVRSMTGLVQLASLTIDSQRIVADPCGGSGGDFFAAAIQGVLAEAERLVAYADTGLPT